MDVLNFINNGGMVEQPNPNYNPKSKNNTEPANVLVPNFNPDTPIGVKMAIYDFNNSWSISKKDSDALADMGVNYDPRVDVTKQLADAQSNWSKAFNALAQTVVSEVGLGTLIAFSDIAGMIIKRSLSDYENPVSEYLSGLQESFKDNVAPVYADPDKNIQNGGLLDAGWWISNLPTVASTLTLLFPGTAMGGAVRGIGKAVGLGKLTKKTRLWVSGISKLKDTNKLKAWQVAVNNPINIERANAGVRNLTDAAFMRLIENYQESKDVHQQTYDSASEKLFAMEENDYKAFLNSNQALVDELKKDGISPDDRDAMAKLIATKASDRTFQMDMSNLVFDVIQLHGLRNIGKGVKKAAGRGVEAAQRQSLATAEEMATGVAKETVKTPFLKKVGQHVWDFTKGNAKFIAEESTEGIEEAVNYIASQEGLTYGKMLLEGTSDGYDANLVTGPFKSWAMMQGNLGEYLKTADLQESAFWGVMGGWIFGAGGNVFNKGRLALHRRAEEKALKENPITGEKVELSTWSQLFEEPETKAARTVIERRAAIFNQLQADLKKIEDGIDVLRGSDEHGQYQSFTGNEEDIKLQKELARTQLENQYKAQLALDALNSGTFDLLLAYYRSPEVKKLMVKLGLANESNIDTYTEQTVRELEEIKELHARHSGHVLNQISALNASRDYNQTIAMNYAQIIANDNIQRSLSVKDLDRRIAAAELTAGEQEAIDRELGTSSNFEGAKEAVRLAALVDMYGRLSADEKALNNTDTTTSLARLNKEQQLRNIRQQKEGIIKELRQTTLAGNTVGASALYTAVKYANSYARNEDGTYSADNEQFARSDEEIINQYLAETKKLVGSDVIPSDDVIRQVSESIQADMERVTSKNGLASANQALFNTYTTLAHLNLQRNMHKSLIVSTKEQIKEKIDYYHNTMNKARVKMIAKADEIIRKAYNQYDGIDNETGQHIEEAIIEAYKGNREAARALAEKYLSVDGANGFVTAAEFMDALDIFNFSSSSNEMLFDWFTKTLKDERNRRNQSGNARRQNTSTNSQAESATQNPNPNTSSEPIIEEQQQQATAPTRQSKNRKPSELIQPNDSRKQVPIKVTINNQGKIVNIKKSSKSNSDGIAYENPDGTLELDLSTLPKHKQLRFANAGFMIVANGVDVINPAQNWAITKNPILSRIQLGSNKGFTIYEPGRIEASENEEASQSQSPVEEIQQVKSAAQAQPQQAPQQATPESPQQAPAQQQPSNPTNPSTGVRGVPDVDDEHSEKPTSLSNNGNIRQNAYDELTTNIAIRGVFGKYIPNILVEEDPDFDAVARLVKVDLQGQSDKVGLTEEELNERIDKIRDELIAARERIKGRNTALEQAAEATSYTARFEEPDTDTFSSLFTSSMEQFLNEYKKVIIVPTVDGKQVVKLEDVLKICNNLYSSQDVTVARGMFDVVKAYLLSAEGRLKYFVPDENIGDKVFEYITMTPEERRQAEDTTFGTFSVNISDFMEIADASMESVRKNYYDTLDSLRKGDKITMQVQEREILFSKNGTTIGNMPRPYVVNDSYVIVNDGWVTDIKLDSNGKIVSKSKDIIVDLFTEQSVAHDDLRALLFKLSNGSNIKDKDIKDFENNPLIQILYQRAKTVDKNNRQQNRPLHENILFVDDAGDINSKRVLKYLTNIFNFGNANANANTKEENIQIVKDNLDIWFGKLYETYDQVYSITDNDEVTIDEITEGLFLRATNNGREYSKMPLIKEGLDGKHKAKIAIATGDENGNNNVLIAGEETRHETQPNGNTLVAVYSRNGTPEYVKAWGCLLSDNVAVTSTGLRPIAMAIRQRFVELLKNLSDKQALGNTEELKKFIASVIAVKGYEGTIPLFRTISPKATFEIEDIHYNGRPDAGIAINYFKPGDKKPYRFRIYTHDRNTFKIAYQYDKIYRADKDDHSNTDATINDLASLFFEFIKNTCNVNISQQAIESDSVDNASFTGFMTKKNGKFIVDIPVNYPNGSFYKEYDSYNDFLMEENLIRVNAKKDENGNNFVRKDPNHRFSQKLSVSLKRKQQLTGQATTNVVDSDSNAEEFEKHKTTIATNKTNVGRTLFSDALGNQALEEFKAILDEEFADDPNRRDILDDILPDRMAYDSRMNGTYKTGNKHGIIAYTKSANAKDPHYLVVENGEKKSVRYPENEHTVVGPLFLNMLSSRSIVRRKRAVKKLIHEKLHKLFQENKEDRAKQLEAIKGVYNEFRNKLNEDLASLDEESRKYKHLVYLKKLFDTISKEHQLEEFIMESLTNDALFTYLNSIDVQTTDNKKKETLFTKIARAIAKFFGWEIKNDSLFMKELNALRDALDESGNEPSSNESSSKERTEEPTARKESEAKQEKPTETESKTSEEQAEEQAEENESEEEVTEEEIVEEEEETIDVDGSLGYTEDDYVEDEDDGSNTARAEELDVLPDDFVRIKSIDSFRDRLPLTLQSRFDALRERGVIETKCS